MVCSKHGCIHIPELSLSPAPHIPHCTHQVPPLLPGCYINVQRFGGLSMVLLKDPLELFVKRREVLLGSRFLCQRDMTYAVEIKRRKNQFLQSFLLYLTCSEIKCAAYHMITPMVIPAVS